jgi:tRNA-splicing ligase RtcB
MGKIVEEYIFGDNLIDEKTKEQFHLAMNYPDALNGALMPDAHYGYTLPIGGVVGTKDTVVPSWVGYDIGCGVSSVKTTFNVEDVIAFKEAIMYQIYEDIPTGLGKHYEKPQYWSTYHVLPKTKWFSMMFSANSGFKQLGSMGSNNHFIEIGASARDHSIWITTHSGSRGIGYKAAQKYIKDAHPENKEKEGSYGFKINSIDGMNYIKDMMLCKRFAEVGRAHILRGVCAAIGTYLDGSLDMVTYLNSTHNYVAYDKQFDLWIHRKGAIDAATGVHHLIPANRKDGVFIVIPYLHSPALNSISHGTGRSMSRKAAKESLDLEEYTDSMGKICGIIGATTIEEAPKAYKDTYQVMMAQTDMCEVYDVLEPIISIKAESKERKRGKNKKTQ